MEENRKDIATNFNYSKADKSITKKRKSNCFANGVSVGAEHFEMLPAESKGGQSLSSSTTFALCPCSPPPEVLQILVFHPLRSCKSRLWSQVGGLPLWAAGPGELALRGPPTLLSAGLRPSACPGLRESERPGQLFLLRPPSPASTRRGGPSRT